jgi:clan AA aspartic protease (TIGR02281 family)
MKTLFILYILFPVLASAEVYKCNVSGVVVYSANRCASGVGEMAYNAGAVSGAHGGSLTVRLGANGVYNVQGALNGLPVSFLLDTGASLTSVSGDSAYALGIKTCDIAGYTSTANGQAPVCRAVISSLSFGGFTFSNLPVLVTPGMRGQSLIGNDLLSKFRIEHSAGGSLILSR